MLALMSDGGYSIAANPALRSIIRPCRRRSIQNLGSEYEQVQETTLSRQVHFHSSLTLTLLQRDAVQYQHEGRRCHPHRLPCPRHELQRLLQLRSRTPRTVLRRRLQLVVYAT